MTEAGQQPRARQPNATEAKTDPANAEPLPCKACDRPAQPGSMFCQDHQNKLRQHKKRRITRAEVLLVFCMLAMLAGYPGLVGPPRADVSGYVLPAESERRGLPWLRVDVRLVRGALLEQLAPLAAKYRQEVEAESLARVLEHAQRERAARDDGSDPASGVQPTPARACLPAAEAAIAAAQRGYRETLKELSARIVATAGVAATEPKDAIEALRAAAAAKVTAEARRLRDEYLSTQLVQQSGTVLGGGTQMDRLCWTVHNKRDIAVRFRGLTLLHNGRELPPAVAEQLWRLPPRDQALRMPGSRGVDNDVLLPGAQHEACFYASRTPVSVDVLDRYGLSTENPNRNGDWRVRWDDIELVDATSARGGSSARRPANQGLAAAFADRLRAFEAQLEERSLIAALEGSASAGAVARARSALLACHQAIEKEKSARELARVIDAIEGGRSDDVEVQVRIRPIVQKGLRDPARLARWIGDARMALDEITVARQEHELGTAYRFQDVDPGHYTLVATSVIDTERPKLWLIPLEVSGPVAQDLVGTGAVDISLRQALENVLLRASG